MHLRLDTPREDILGLRPVLREAFEQLLNLEEFVAKNYELYLDLYDRQNAFVWRNWPKLKRMALGGASCDSTFWLQIALHSSLNTLFIRELNDISVFDPKSEYLQHTNRPLRFVILTSPSWRVEEADYWSECDWMTLDPKNNMSINEYMVPSCPEEDG
jgi:hypothetical protein